MKWKEYTATLPEREHKRLAIALGAGLREARIGVQTTLENGDHEVVRDHVAAALAQLTDALNLLAPPAVGD